MKNLIETDLNHILKHTKRLWPQIRNKRIFITGGTGFVGRWLVESFVWANEKLKLNATMGILTRRPERFKRQAPHLASNKAVRLCRGDIRSFSFPKGRFEFMIHAAAENESGPDSPVAYDTNVKGARRTLDFAAAHGVKKFLLVSSGAVYGKQPATLGRIPEDYTGAPETTELGSFYGQSKRTSELFGVFCAKKNGLEVKIARCFSFLGPFLPLDFKYAAGNFMRDALRREAIRVKCDHRVYRSYLYASDLAIWLWTILFKGRSCRPYNVGSAQSVTIRELARKIAGAFTSRPVVEFAKKKCSAYVERYVPDTRRAEKELGLCQTVNLTEGIRRMAEFYSYGSWKNVNLGKGE